MTPLFEFQMDFMGTCDPFCEVEWQGTVLKTSVIKQSLAPTWEETLSFPITRLDDVSALSGISLVLKDWDAFSLPDAVGTAKICKDDIIAVVSQAQPRRQLTLPIFAADATAVVGNDKEDCIVEVRLTCVLQQSSTSKEQVATRRSNVRSLRPEGLELEQVSSMAAEMLQFLAALYTAVPEVSDAAPKIYHVAAAQYKKVREHFQQTLLHNAQLLMYLASHLEQLMHGTKQ